MQSLTMNKINVDKNVNTNDENKTDELVKEEQKSRFIHLRAKGYSYAYIAKELSVSTSTLTNWNQELQEIIAQTKAMELEALQEEYFLLKEGRIKLLGKQLRAIQKEISGRYLLFSSSFVLIYINLSSIDISYNHL